MGRLSRLAAMSGAEMRWRVTSAARSTALRAAWTVRRPRWRRQALAGILSRTSAEEARRAARAGDLGAAHRWLTRSCLAEPPRFVVAPSMRAGLVEQITAAFPGSPADAVARADRVLAGTYDLLGYRDLRFATSHGSPDWHWDPVHRRRAPARYWSAVPFLDPSCGDHKVIWELNRQQHLLVLGRAYWLTGDRQYRDAAIAQVRAWLAANPPLTGINWSSMLELAFRTLSWVWMVHLCADDPDEEDPWLPDLLVGVDRQLRHVEQNLSYYFSPNTHLLGEALALYVAGRSLPWLSRATTWADTGRRILLAEIARQVAPDGGHVERSAHYHRYTLDFYMFALAVARITRDEAAAAFESAVGRLGFAARLLADNRGRLPHLGDDDGGLLLPFCGRAPDDVRDSLASAGALVERPDLRVSNAPEESCWLLAHPTLAPLLEQSRTVPPVESIGSAALPATGYYVSRSNAGDHAVIDAGPHGFANGGHAHADALSLTLTVRGVPLLIDPGTACYTVDQRTRDRFRSSVQHNTVTIDRRSQSVPAGPFHWATTAQATAERWRTNAGFDYLEAAHDGYAPLVHRRHVLAVHGDLLVVADLVDGLGAHDVQAHWHLDPRWEVQASHRRARLRTPGERVEMAVSQGTIESITGGEAEAVGWHAPVYGRVEPTTTLRVSVFAMTPVWIVTVFGLNPANDVQSVDPVPVWAEAGHLAWSTAVRIVRRQSVDLFGIAATSTPDLRSSSAGAAEPSRHEPAAGWRMGHYETDARMLFCRTREGVSRIALVDGSRVRSTDRQGVDVRAARLVPDLHLDLATPGGLAMSEARVAGPLSGTLVRVQGRTLALAPERRATARASSRRRADAGLRTRGARVDR